MRPYPSHTGMPISSKNCNTFTDVAAPPAPIHLRLPPNDSRIFLNTNYYIYILSVTILSI